MGRFEMKLIGAVLVALASADQLTRLTTNLATKWREVETMKQVTITDEDLNSALQKDTMSHTRVKGVRGIKLMPDAGSCGLHWDLCPNMCNLNETLENYFQEIVGNKMTKYQEWKTQTQTFKQRILKDLEGKLDQIPELEDQLRRGRLDLEKRQEVFLTTISDHIGQAIAIKERLEEIKGDLNDIGRELTGLNKKVGDAHTDCYDQAPCMAVPTCKLGVASGKSCQEIAENGLDVDAQGDPTLNKETAVHIIQPNPSLEAKAVICEFDYKGTGLTVVQNRENNTGSFSGDFNNGFGTTVGYDDAACGTANYYLGNKYIKELVKTAKTVRVKSGTSVDQWSSVQVRGSSYSLGSAKHICGDDVTKASEVTMNSSGLNGRWDEFSRILIGAAKSEFDEMCMMSDDYGGDDYGSYGGKDSSSYPNY